MVIKYCTYKSCITKQKILWYGILLMVYDARANFLPCYISKFRLSCSSKPSVPSRAIFLKNDVDRYNLNSLQFWLSKNNYFYFKWHCVKIGRHIHLL